MTSTTDQFIENLKPEEEQPPFEFKTKEGKVYTFDTKDERDRFGIEYSVGNLVAEGYGKIVETDDGPAFQINDRGRKYLEELTKGTKNEA